MSGSTASSRNSGAPEPKQIDGDAREQSEHQVRRHHRYRFTDHQRRGRPRRTELRDENGVDGNIQHQGADSQAEQGSELIEGDTGIAEDSLKRGQWDGQEEDGERGRGQDEPRSTQSKHGVLPEDDPRHCEQGPDAVRQVARPADDTPGDIPRRLDKRRDESLHKEDGDRENDDDRIKGQAVQPQLCLCADEGHHDAGHRQIDAPDDLDGAQGQRHCRHLPPSAPGSSSTSGRWIS